MFYHEYQPPTELKKYIQCFWVLEHDYREQYHTHEHLWADTHIELIFSFGQPYYLKTKSKKTDLPKSFAIGPFKKELLLYSTGFTGFVAVRFYPWGACQFFKKPIPQMVNKIISTHEILNKDAITIEKQLADKSREEKLNIITNYFLEKYKQLPTTKIISQPIAQEIINKKGIVKITDLTKKFNINLRKLQRSFIDEIGLSAKICSRITRFNNAKHLIEQNPDISLASVTYETGFSDQPHFNKNFKEMFGYTPASFKKLMKDFVLNSADFQMDVAFLQDK